jgi:hypothetical protein
MEHLHRFAVQYISYYIYWRDQLYSLCFCIIGGMYSYDAFSILYLGYLLPLPPPPREPSPCNALSVVYNLSQYVVYCIGNNFE